MYWLGKFVIDDFSFPPNPRSFRSTFHNVALASLTSLHIEVLRLWESEPVDNGGLELLRRLHLATVSGVREERIVVVKFRNLKKSVSREITDYQEITATNQHF